MTHEQIIRTARVYVTMRLFGRPVQLVDMNLTVSEADEILIICRRFSEYLSKIEGITGKVNSLFTLP